LPLSNSQLKKYRPFQGKTKDELEEKAKSSLNECVTVTLDDERKIKPAIEHPVTPIRGPNLEIPTLILDELRQRSPKRDTHSLQKKIMKLITEAEDSIFKEPLEPIPWLVEARHRIRSIRSIRSIIRKTTPGIYSVYVIRLSRINKGKLESGAYVGQTQFSIDERFINHIKGNLYESSRHVYKEGQEVLHSLITPYLKNMSFDDSKDLEEEVFEILKGCHGLKYRRGGT